MSRYADFGSRRPNPIIGAMLMGAMARAMATPPVVEQEKPELKCSRTACQEPIADKGHYLIYNEPSTGIPRPYCPSCGRKIIEPNQKYDDLKLRYEIIRPICADTVS
jgi:hypothetical protein